MDKKIQELLKEREKLRFAVLKELMRIDKKMKAGEDLYE